MDLSKLPRLSNTQQTPPSGQASTPQDPSAQPTTTQPIATAQPIAYNSPSTPPPPSPARIEAWLSFAIGAFLLFMFPRFLQWASSRVFHTHFDEFVQPDGITVVPYQAVPEFWMDLGPVLFGFVLIFDGFVLMTRRRGLLMFSLGLTILATAYNLIYMVMTYREYGFAPISFLAAAFGVYIGFYQWNTWKTMRRVTPAST